MDIDVLGALDVRENGVSVTPTAPKPRQLLALLALQADQVVHVPVLIEELWAGTPPRSARTNLQTYVLQVRDHIAVALSKDPADRPARTSKDVLVTAPGGYMLVSGAEGVSDVREFDRLAGMGYRAMDAGDYPGAAETLRQALALWTGTPFSGVQTGGQLGMEVRRLEESRLRALDQRIDADLRLGRHRELLAELTVLVSRYRTHENLHAQFMIALHRSGRRGEAVGHYRRLRNTLVQELGIEPSVRLGRLQKALLATPAGDGRSPQDGSVLPLRGAGAVPIS
ncbi:AfsR/SARP family transcriptional regulator [Streptomyces sp. NBC_01257]|uniref:AfsR/SARP family transcriptional regulator n=1 Tax=Streptomyces sp. NBC_01257 TaxID=2903799 RepID=UPI002DD9B4F4|nr:AfsR/SARP family transcriptional regulator [Streptomyces sp. NBC_01257]WRZ62632.1 AfsR/SARP family transcriptional regulator [Streptomyces sp. NBC_01257]